MGRLVRKARRKAHLARTEQAAYLVRKREARVLLDRWRKAIAATVSTFWEEKRARWTTNGACLHEAFRLINRSKSTIPFSPEEMTAKWRPIFNAPPPATCKDEEDRRFLEGMDWGPRGADRDISLEEVQEAIRSSANGKASGGDDLPFEVWKRLPKSALITFRDLLSSILKEPATYPALWKEAPVVLIPKGTDKEPTELDYRPITLLCGAAKLLEKILWSRAKTWGVPLTFEQGGFVSDRGCPEQSWRVKIQQDAMLASQRAGSIVLLDAKKAYDSVPHHKLIRALLKIPAIPRYFVEYIYHWIRGHRRRLVINGILCEEWIEVAKGVPQGSILSPFLFNIYVDPFLKTLVALPGISTTVLDRDGTPCTFSISGLGYADDMAEGVRTARDGVRFAEICEKHEKDQGIAWSVVKTVQMELGAQRKRALKIRINGSEVQRVEECRYLGTTFRVGGLENLNSARFTKSIQDNQIRGLFRHFDAAQKCPLLVGKLIVTLSHLAQLLWGSEQYPLGPLSDQESTWMGLHRRVLGGYHTDSHSKAMTFLGARPLYLYRRRRFVAFVLKILAGPFDPLRQTMAAGWQTPLPWFVDARKEFQAALDGGWFKKGRTHLIPQRQIPKLGQVFANLTPEERIAKKDSVLAAMETAWTSEETTLYQPNPLATLPPDLHPRLAFRFIAGNFNPRDICRDKTEVPDCWVCKAGKGDRPEHLVRCPDPRVRTIIRDALGAMGKQSTDDNLERLATALECPTAGRLTAYGATDHLPAFARTFLRLWRLRVKAWKADHIDRGQRYGSYTGWARWRSAAPEGQQQRREQLSHMLLQQGQASHPPQQQQQQQQHHHHSQQQQQHQHQQQQQQYLLSSSMIERQARLAALIEADDDELGAPDAPAPLSLSSLLSAPPSALPLPPQQQQQQRRRYHPTFPLSLSSLLAAPPPALLPPSRQQQQQRRHHHLIFLPGARNTEPGRTSTSQASEEPSGICTPAEPVRNTGKRVDQVRKKGDILLPPSSASSPDLPPRDQASTGTNGGATFGRLARLDAREARRIAIEAQRPAPGHCRGCELIDCEECNPVSPRVEAPPPCPAMLTEQIDVREDDSAPQAVQPEIQATAWTRLKSRYAVSGCFSLQSILADTEEQIEAAQVDRNGHAEDQFSLDRRARLLARAALGDHRNQLGPIAEARRYFPASQ